MTILSTISSYAVLCKYNIHIHLLKICHGDTIHSIVISSFSYMCIYVHNCYIIICEMCADI